MTVVDASVVIELIASEDAAHREAALAVLPPATRPWWAPDLVYFEVFSAIRRLTQRGNLEPPSAEVALERLYDIPIETTSTAALIPAAWMLRDRCSAADAFYAALAQRRAEPSLTIDSGWGRAATAVGGEVLTLGGG
ncbi:MAG: type II toxin-antitoxin system VapC family toxin [Thermoleophilaceae bacterium]